MIKVSIFLVAIFVSSLSLAEYDYSGEVKCFQQAGDSLGKGNFYSLNNGRDAVYMLKDGNIGGVPDNSKANSGFFLVQNQKLQFCPLAWSNSKAANVKFTDSSGNTVKLTRRLAEPYFQEGGEWFTSYFPTNCEDVSGNTKTTQMLRNIFIASIKKQSEAGKPYDKCLNTRQVNIKASDLPYTDGSGNLPSTTDIPIEQ